MYILFSKNFARVQKMTNMRYVFFMCTCFVCVLVLYLYLYLFSICICLVFVFSSYRPVAGAQHKGRLSSARYPPVPLPCLFCLSRGHSPQWQGNQHIARPRGEILQNGRANCFPLEQIEVKIKRDFVHQK